ncbi:MAG: hypothetical protein NTV16_02410 [Actinobacteria bacterium]|nr:hypothetical protein [Actinomycetota bacterium]
MKAKLVPLYFKSGMDKDFKKQTLNLKNLLKDVAEIIEPIPLGEKLPAADGVIFPQLIGDAFKQIEMLKKINIPIIITTSDFGTVNMWDWEIVAFMKTEGIDVFSPYSLELTKIICKSLALKRDLKKTKFLVFQDTPGVGGMQGEIFRRFYWWEDRFTELLNRKFGVSLIKKSFKELGAQAKEISDKAVKEVIKNRDINTEKLTDKALNSAVKIYIKIKEELDKDEDIKGVGINCLNESFYSDSTPCLAWSMLYEDKRMIWSCEADTSALMSMYMMNKVLDAKIMMSNIYPFLMGMAALKHERIDKFPEVKEDPQNCALIVHCGYFGVVPKPFCTSWTVRPKVLAIVDDNAIALDARFPEGDLTISKLDSTLKELMVIEGNLERYVQYPGSDCRNGALVRVPDGYKMMELFNSHHNCFLVGRQKEGLKNLAKVFGLEIKTI